jgi:hypothetical protein
LRATGAVAMVIVMRIRYLWYRDKSTQGPAIGVALSDADTSSRSVGRLLPRDGHGRPIRDVGPSARDSNRVVVGDSETEELGHVGHGAVEELEVTDGELAGSEPVRTEVRGALGLIEE